MKEHINILELAVNDGLPKAVDENSTVSLEAFKELYDAGYIDALDVSDLNGHAYKNPKITIEGREYLSQLKQKSILARYGKTIFKWLFGILAAVLAAYIVKNYIG